MDNTDPNQDKEKNRAERESKAEEAAQSFQEKSQASEQKFSERIKNLFSAKNVTKTVVLETLEMAPFLAGYSLADLWVAVEGVSDIVIGLQNKDYTRALKGGAKLGAAAIPGLPVSGFAPSLDQLLPNEERQRVAEEQDRPTPNPGQQTRTL